MGTGASVTGAQLKVIPESPGIPEAADPPLEGNRERFKNRSVSLPLRQSHQVLVCKDVSYQNKAPTTDKHFPKGISLAQATVPQPHVHLESLDLQNSAL